MSNVNKSDPKEKKTLVQVQVRLEPQELADLKACADTECRTMASVLRLIPDGHPNSPAYGHLKLPHLN